MTRNERLVVLAWVIAFALAALSAIFGIGFG